MKLFTFKILTCFALLFLFSSCKQKYTCTCTSDADGSIVRNPEYHLSKSNAESACNNANAEEGVTCVLEKK